jgi:hypothetical protein
MPCGFYPKPYTLLFVQQAEQAPVQFTLTRRRAKKLSRAHDASNDRVSGSYSSHRRQPEGHRRQSDPDGCGRQTSFASGLGDPLPPSRAFHASRRFEIFGQCLGDVVARAEDVLSDDVRFDPGGQGTRGNFGEGVLECKDRFLLKDAVAVVQIGARGLDRLRCNGSAL